MKALCQIEQFSYRIGSATLLQSIDWQLPAGARIALCAVNGAGKSTLLSTLAQRARPQQHTLPAKARLSGHIKWNLSSTSARALAYYPQYAPIFFSLSLFDAWCVHQHPPQRAACQRWLVQLRAQVAHALPADLTIDTALGALDYGSAKLLSILLLLHPETQCYLFDEVFAGLNQAHTQLLSAQLHALPAQVSWLMTEHHLPPLRDLCQQVALLHQGTLVWQGLWQTIGPAQAAYYPQLSAL